LIYKELEPTLRNRLGNLRAVASLLLVAALPSFANAQYAACPSTSPLRDSTDSSYLILVARVTLASFDRPRPESERPYASAHRTYLVYDSAVYLRGHRNDTNRDLYAALPESGGPDWEVGHLYLLVLVHLPELERGQAKGLRAVYWTSACLGAQPVSSVEQARRLVQGP